MDSGRWTMGDLGNRTERIYGRASLKKLATEVGMAQADTLYRYCAVSAFYEPRIRIQFPALAYSHYRTAMRAGDDAELFLVQAQDNGWPVAELARAVAAAIGKPVPPRLLYSGQGSAIEGTFSWFISLARPDEAELEHEQRVTVKVYAVEEGAQS